jgi:hypothetical protein
VRSAVNESAAVFSDGCHGGLIRAWVRSRRMVGFTRASGTGEGDWRMITF